jgi:hypothetical protein
MLFWGKKIPPYCENHMKHKNTLCGQNVQVMYVQAGDTYSKWYSNYWALKKLIICLAGRLGPRN